MKSKNYPLVILVVGIVSILFAPILFTQFGIISFNNTGQIGDTIGGITAPITGIIGSILVYLALRAQIRANEIIQTQISEQKIDEKDKKLLSYISELYGYFQRAISDFEYKDSNGNGALIKILSELSRINRKVAHDDSVFEKGKIAELNALFNLEKLFVKQLTKSTIDENDKEYFKELIRFHLESFVLPHINFESTIAPCEICGSKEHNGIPFKLAEIIKSIEQSL